ncbi:MAG TPA: hypothetical protein VF950_13195 [Planctomycetota bacterium]
MSETKACPACAETIAVAAIKCRWCGEALKAAPPSNDEEHLRLLSIFHYVSAALTAFFACFPLLHVGLGLAVLLSPETVSSEGDPPPAWFGLFFVVIGGAFVLAGWTLAVLKFFTGRCLARRRRRTFCVIVACVCCVLPPIGTILGVFTLVVLSRPSVKALFDTGDAAS